MKKSSLSRYRFPAVAAVITGKASGRTIQKAVTDGAGFLELRVDTFREQGIGPLVESIKGIRKLKGARAVPLIITVRKKEEGGGARISDKQRSAIFEALMPYAGLIDVELSSARALKGIIRLAKKGGKAVIISHHDFRKTPAEAGVRRIIKRALSAGADIVKVAALAKSAGDLRTLAKAALDYRNLIVIAMGKPGVSSRVFFPALGSLITYGATSKKTAPGQISLKGLKKELGFYGII